MEDDSACSSRMVVRLEEPVTDETNSLHLIKDGIGIMKKLSHPNLVGLVKVLDDLEEASLHLIMELCKKER